MRHGFALGIAALLLSAPYAAVAYDPFEDAPPREDERPRLSFTLWGGQDNGVGSGTGSSPLGAGELAWRFDTLELGALAERVKLSGNTAWSPVYLLRLTERFETRKGIEGSLTFGVGAGRDQRWTAWYQVTLGVRLDLGPLFLAGELGFEQADLLRLAAGVGARF